MELGFYKGTAADYNAKKDKISKGGLIVTKENNSSATGNLYINDNGTHVQLSSNKALTDIALASNVITATALNGTTKTVNLSNYVPDASLSKTSTKPIQNKAVATQLEIISGNVGTNTANIATNTGNIATNTSNISKNTTNIGKNTEAIATINTNLGDLTGTVNAEKGKLSTAQTDIGNLQEAVATLQQQNSDFVEIHVALEDRINTNAGTISNHEQALDSLSEDFAELSGNLTEAERRLQGNINTNAGLISENTRKITEMSGSVGTLQSQMSSAQTTIGQHTSALQAIEAGAEVNAIETISVNGQNQTIDNKRNVNIAVPTGALASLDSVGIDQLNANLKSTINGKVNTSDYNTKISALEGADSAMNADITKLKTAVGNSTSIANDISSAVGKAKNELTQDIAAAKGEANGYTDGKIATVNGEINTLKGTVNSHDSRIGAMEPFFAAYSQDAQFVQTLSQIQTYIKEDADGASQLINRVGANETAISGLQTSVENVISVNNSQNGRLDTIEAGTYNKIDKITVNGNEVPIAGKTAAISLGELAFSSKVTENLLDSNVAESINNKVTIDAYNTKIGTLEAADAKFTTDIDNLQKTVATKASTDSVSTLTGQVGQLSTTVSNMNKTVSSLQGTVSGHSTSIGNMQNEMSNISSTVTGQGKMIETIEANYITKADKAALEGSISGNTNRIKDLEDTRIRGVRIDTSAKKLYVTPPSGGSEIPYNIPDTTYTAATTSKDGLMSKSDKSKLNGLPQIKFCTKAQYESYGSGVNSDGILYFIQG